MVMLTNDTAPIAAPEWVGDYDGRWFVLQTKSRQEKALANDLQARGVKHYLPLIRAVRFYGGRKAVVELPLFQGYMFLRGSIEDAYSCDRSGRVANIIQVHDQDRMTWELRNICLAVSRGVALDPYPYLKTGVRVQVRSGPFRGLQGLVDGRTGSGLLILQVDLLGRAVAMEIDGSLLEVID